MIRESARRTAIGIVLLAGVAVAAACGSILGIDSGQPETDASAPDSGSPMVGNDGSPNDTGASGDDSASPPGDSGASGDGRNLACEAGDYCQTHCGGTDPCGVGCTDNCSTAPGWSCDPDGSTCTCVHDPSWCNNRCGMITDNCGRSYDCGVCDGGQCVPDANPCATQQCGTAIDSCGGMTTCGNAGACAGGGICEDGGSCCTAYGNPCSQGAVWCSSAPNGCGGHVTCPGCPTGEQCGSNDQCSCPTLTCGSSCNTTVSNGCSMMFCSSGSCTTGICDTTTDSCCTPNLQSCMANPCGENNCHQPCGGTCIDGGPEGGTCGSVGANCSSSGECCTFSCSTNPASVTGGTCETSCNAAGNPCANDTQCCYPYQCSNGTAIIPFLSPPDGGISPGICMP
jgi:hypothetical protein